MNFPKLILYIFLIPIFVTSFGQPVDIVVDAWVLDISGRPMPEAFGPGTVWDLSDAPVERMAERRWSKYGGKELLAANGLNMHDFEARLQDFATCRFTTPDPRQWEYMGASSYAYCNGDPVNNVDPSGEFIETLWDIANILIGIDNVREDIANNNWGAAAVDAALTLVDVGATLLPCVPGGASATVKAARTADMALDAAEAAKAVEATSKAKKVHGNSATSENA